MGAAPLEGSALAQAEQAADLAQADPADATRLAKSVLARDSLDDEARAVALWALGLAAREIGALEDADAHLRDAVLVADAAGLAGRAARARLSHSLVLVYRGDTDAALAALEAARPHLAGVEAGHCDVQHSLLMIRLGRFEAALASAQRALPLLQAGGDRLAEARLRSNLGVLHVYLGRYADAETELEAGRALAVELGQTLLEARAVHNLGFVHGRRGDVPRALATFDEADEAYRRLADPEGHVQVLDADRAEVLLSAGLAAEARDRAEASLAALVAAENVTDRAEVLLLVARCRLAAGDRTGAVAAASEAAAAFAEQDRPAWAAVARLVAAEADDGAAPAGVVAVAEALRDARWPAEEQRAWLRAAVAFLDDGDGRGAEGPLAAASRWRVTAAERVRAWHATALLRLGRGDRAGTRRALRAGLAVVDEQRATLGAAELRAHASTAGVELARLGLRLAVEDRRPREVLRWLESLRAVSVLTPPARPPDDGALADDLARLRAAEAERRSATDPAADRALARTISDLEASIARRTRRVGRSGDGGDRFDLDAVLDALGDRVLLEYAELDGELLGVSVARRRVRSFRLGPAGEVTAEAASAIVALHRLARPGASAASASAALAALERALDVLDRRLVAPFAAVLRDRAAVVVPPASLRRLPWAGLVGLAGRPFSVAPSAAAWSRAVSAGPGDGSALLAAGPDLDGAVAEVESLASLYPAATVLRPPASTCAAVLDRLGGGVAHVAAHGTFRADNSLFSSLLLADGPLTVHELQTARRCPARWVLSSCDAGVSAGAGGDEILGLGAALLSMGASTVVAPVTPVSDRATRPFMVDLHRRLVAGDDPATALARLGARPAEDPEARAAQVAFAAIGS